MNSQQAFDQMVEHLATQQQQAVNSEAVCTYRNERGEMCIVGALIPNDQYDPSFEGLCALSVVSRIPALSEVDVRLLNDMQCAYDGRGYWGRAGFCGWHIVRSIGERFELDTSICLNNPE
jgi:hypothetical protein